MGHVVGMGQLGVGEVGKGIGCPPNPPRGKLGAMTWRIEAWRNPVSLQLLPSASAPRGILEP